MKLSDGAADRLERPVRTRCHYEEPKLNDERRPRKSTAPWKQRSADKKIATNAGCISARGPKGLKPAKHQKANFHTQQTNQRINA